MPRQSIHFIRLDVCLISAWQARHPSDTFLHQVVHPLQLSQSTNQLVNHLTHRLSKNLSLGTICWITPWNTWPILISSGKQHRKETWREWLKFCPLIRGDWKFHRMSKRLNTIPSAETNGTFSRSVKARIERRNWTELNWHGLDFDELTNRQGGRAGLTLVDAYVSVVK